MENKTKGAGDDYPVILQDPIKADFTIPHDQFVAVQNAAMIRLTDGKLFIKKEAVIELMETEFNDLQKELASMKEVVKDLLPLAQEVFDSITIDDAETHREYISLKALLDRAKTLLR